MDCLRHRYWLFAVVVACALTAPDAGWSAEPPPEERARELHKKAQAAVDDDNYEEALKLLRQAWALHKREAYICDIGTFELEVGQPRAALESFATCLKMLSPTQKAGIGEIVKLQRKEAEKRTRMGALRLESNVEGAEVLVDGKLVATLPLLAPILVEPGEHGVLIRARGYLPGGFVTDFAAGQQKEFRVPLAPAEGSAAPSPAGSPPSASGSAVAPTASAPGAAGSSRSAGAAAPPGEAAAPTTASLRSQALFATGIGLSVAGMAVAVGGFVAAAGARAAGDEQQRALKATGLEHPCTSPVLHRAACVERDGEIARAEALTVVGAVGLAAAAAGGALVVIDLVRSGTRDTKAGTRAAFVVDRGGGALTISGSF